MAHCLSWRMDRISLGNVSPLYLVQHFKKQESIVKGTIPSFRIGAATTAKEKGISDVHIKMLGRWQSSAYQLYIRTPQEQLAKLSKELVASKD